jgi:S-adenosyl methyltransferase
MTPIRTSADERLGDAQRPDDIRIDVPHPARVYDYWLGGKDNFAADRHAAEERRWRLAAC